MIKFGELEKLEEAKREWVVANLERRLGHSLDQVTREERAFIEREIRILLWLEEDESDSPEHSSFRLSEGP